jgi:hypothetical protein
MRHAILLILLAAGLPNPQYWTKSSIVAFSQPTEIPGRMLEPGTYVFKFVRAEGETHIVEVLDAAETQVLATLTALADHRARPRYDTIIVYHDIEAGNPAVRSWYYPGELTGYEFVYPKDRACELARLSNQAVMGGEKENGVVIAVTPNGVEVVVHSPAVQKGDRDTTRQKPRPQPRDQ